MAVMQERDLENKTVVLSRFSTRRILSHKANFFDGEKVETV